MDKHTFIASHLRNSIAVKEQIIRHHIDDIITVTDRLVQSLQLGNKLLICGNGGSAADAQHLAAELVIRLSHDFERPAIPAIALSTDTSILTAGGNDIGFINVFRRQVEALGRKGDILIGISTSGNSENILLALKKAREIGMITMGLLGGNGGKARPLCDHSIIIPSDNVQHIQESHITIGHIIIEMVEKELFQENNTK